MPKLSRLLACASALAVGASATTFAVLGPVGPAAAATSCAPLDDPVYQRVNPTSQANLLTTSQNEATNAGVNHGFSQDLGAPFRASTASATGLIGVHRLYKASSGDFVWIKAGPEVTSAVNNHGYADQGVRFYASPDQGTGCVPIYRFLKSGKHRFTTEAGRAALLAAGWTAEGVAFYAAPEAVTDTTFSIAILPDTQAETNTGDPRFPGRTAWLAANKTSLDLRFVMHTGDVVNWGWLVPSQYTVARNAMADIENAGLPYALTIGNHDTRAVGWNGQAGSTGYGGSAYQNNPECPGRLGAAQCKSNLLVRHTEEFNANFTAARYTGVGGAFEAGKVDNIYSTFTAGGKKWLVLTLELAPRTEAVNWAKQVIASHADHNVIVQTHYYLDDAGAGASSANITNSNTGYGANSGKYLWDNLIKVYPNIRMVFSGHTGDAGYREDTGTNGNKIASFLHNNVDGTGNAVRLLEINTATGTASSRIYVPNKNTTLASYNTNTTGLNFN